MIVWLRRIREGYFSFRGRLPRKIFWLRMLVLYMAMQVLAGAVAYGVPALGFSEQATLYASLAMTFLFWVGSASLWVRRFHDRNVSGWWYAAFFAFILGVFSYLVYAVALTGARRRLRIWCSRSISSSRRSWRGSSWRCASASAGARRGRTGTARTLWA